MTMKERELEVRERGQIRITMERRKRGRSKREK